MFSWFKPRCPCDTYQKAWIEDRLHWLYNEFPDNVYNGRRMILPLAEFFPARYDASDESVLALFQRVCGYMGVDADDIRLEIVADAKESFWLVNDEGQVIPQAGGVFVYGENQCVVRIDRLELRDPMGLVGTIAHELAHVRLLGEHRYDATAFDNELLTDLTVVYLGLGIFRTNSQRYYRSIDSHWPGTDVRRPEYMTPPMFAWALAHVAWHNNQRWPAWAAHLQMGPRSDLKQALKYLWTTEDSVFRP